MFLLHIQLAKAKIKTAALVYSRSFEFVYFLSYWFSYD